MGLQAEPPILYGLAPLDGRTKELQRNAIASIAWIVPRPTAGKTWDLGMLAECAALCEMIEKLGLLAWSLSGATVTDLVSRTAGSNASK